MVVFVNAHHILMRSSLVQGPLSSMVLIYGVLGPAAAWIVLGWVARSSERADDAAQARRRAASDLGRRNRQIEGLYATTRLLAGARQLEHVLEPIAEAVRRAADARGVLLVWLADDRDLKIRAGEVPEDAAEPAQRADPCRSCPNGLPGGLGEDAQCLPMRAGSTTLGCLRLYGAEHDPITRRGVEALVAELTFAWSARHAEARARAALLRTERRLLTSTDTGDVTASFLSSVAEALGAQTAQYHPPAEVEPRQRHERWRGDKEEEPDRVVWDDGRRALRVVAPGGGTLALDFAAPQMTRTLNPTFLEFLATHAALVHDLTHRTAKAIWEERGRLAGEIHDSLAQTLAYLHLQIARTSAELANGYPEALQVRLRDLAEHTLDAYAGVREVIDDLRLMPQPGESLAGFLERAAGAACTRAGAELSVDISQGASAESAEAAQLARVVQEAVVNATHHGLARHVELRGRRTPSGGLELEVHDDGVGFEPHASTNVGHHGLAVMRERIADIGGHVEIHSSKNVGTTVRLFVPGAPSAKPLTDREGRGP